MSENTFRRLPSTICSTKALLLERSTSFRSARKATSPMGLTKWPDSARAPAARTAPPLSTSLDTSAEPAKAGWFLIQTVPSTLKCIMNHNFVGNGICLPRAMNPWPQNHDQGTYYSTQGALLYGIIRCRWSLYYLLQSQSIFIYHSHGDI